MKNVGIRTELKEFKRQRILQEVLNLFYERGFHGTTLDALAERMQVTKPFIYQFFKSKEDLLLAIQDRGTQQIVELVDSLLNQPGPPAERLRFFVRRFAMQNIEAQAISAIFIQEEKNFSAASMRAVRRKYREFDNKLEQLIAEGIKSGDFKVENSRLAALAITGMVRWIHRWFKEGGKLSGPQVADIFATYALNLVGYRPEQDTARTRK
jgi:AcrR family transcriptional regulator